MLENEDLIDSFTNEAIECTANIEAGLNKLKTIGYNNEILFEIFRSSHNIKGAAFLIGLKKIVSLSYAMEDVLIELKEKRLELSIKIIDPLLAANDCLKTMVNNVLDSNAMDISMHIKNIYNIRENTPG